VGLIHYHNGGVLQQPIPQLQLLLQASQRVCQRLPARYTGTLPCTFSTLPMVACRQRPAVPCQDICRSLLITSCMIINSQP
jgi:hypothetical protein